MFTVAFISEGKVVNQFSVADGSKLSEPVLKPREGYIFDGWYKDDRFVNAWNFATDMVTTNVSLHVKWTYDFWKPKSGDVFIAGYASNTSGTVHTAKIWKNGVERNLTGTTGKANAYSVFVSGSDVYVAGYEGNNARLWKNGEIQNLTDGVGAFSVFVSGGDVYVAGIGRNGTTNVAKVWKNGSLLYNLSDGTRNAGARSIFVSGDDVYVAGYESNGTRNIAKVWKNGIAQNLTDGTRDAQALSIFVSGSDVYVAGYDRNINGTGSTAKYWKNGNVQNLTSGTTVLQGVSANSIFVSGNDVFVAGANDNLHATLWKNNTEQVLINDFRASVACSVYVSGGDVYMVINHDVTDNGICAVKLWKNNNIQNITNGTRVEEPFSVFVVE